MITTLLSLSLSLSPPAAPGSHLWVVNELFSDTTGQIQFVELRESAGASNEINIAGKSVTAMSTGMSFTFPANLPPGSTANRSILLGTSSFAALPGAPAVDHIIPAGFFSTGGDTLQFHIYAGSVLSFAAGELPTDGSCSLSRGGVVGLSSPENFAGASGHVSTSPAATATVYDGSTPGSMVNPDRLATQPVVLGTNWSATVTPQASRTGTAGFDIAVVLIQSGGEPATTLVLDLAPIVVGFGSAPASQLLITGTPLTSCITNLNGPGAASSPCTVPVPLRCSLLGMPWYAQAVVLGNVTGDGVDDLDPMFTNGVMGLIGSH